MTPRCLPLLLLAACFPVIDKDTHDDVYDVYDSSDTASGTDGPTEPTGETGETGGPHGDPSIRGWGTLAMAFQFGWDPVAGQARSVTIDGYLTPIEVQPSFDLYLGASGWNGDLQRTTEYCTISFPLTGSVVDPALAQADPRLWTALLVAADATTDCFDGVDGDLDVDTYGSDFHTYLQSLGDWGVGAGEVDDASYDALAPYLTTPDLTPEHLIGGSFFMGALFDPADVDEAFGFAWQLDSEYSVVVEPGMYIAVPLDPATLDLGQGDIAQAWYDVSSLYLYTVQ